MIIAMSRFRVQNHREQDVRQAFLDRPRLVDDQAGFLGLEVFQDPADLAVFYLVTRWSDPLSFHSWHSSHAHHASHAFMPKGLQLDSAFTELRILERVESGPGRQALEHFAADWGALLRAHLASSPTAHGVMAAPDGSILAATPAMEKLLAGDPGRLDGQPLWSFLTPESASQLRGRVAAGCRHPESRFALTFPGAAAAQRVLLCNLDVQPHAFALLGEPVAGQSDIPEGR